MRWASGRVKSRSYGTLYIYGLQVYCIRLVLCGARLVFLQRTLRPWVARAGAPGGMRVLRDPFRQCAQYVPEPSVPYLVARSSPLRLSLAAANCSELPALA